MEFVHDAPVCPSSEAETDSGREAREQQGERRDQKSKTETETKDGTEIEKRQKNKELEHRGCSVREEGRERGKCGRLR